MILAIIQARMSSTRLPGKVLAPIGNRPLLWHVLNRLSFVPSIDQAVVATSVEPADDRIADFCLENRFEYFRGSESDVLDRFYHTTKHYSADVVVRITADCPLIDPEIVDKVISIQLGGAWDYTSNTIDRTFPDGLDVEAFTFEALKKAWYEATLMSEREHVTPYIWKNRKLFKVCQFTQKKNLSDMRWTVDEPEDLELVRRIYELLYNDRSIFMMQDILGLLQQHPDIAKTNRGFICNEGYCQSLREDRIVQAAKEINCGGIGNGC